MKRIVLLSCFMMMTAVTWAQGGPNKTGEYYKAADGKKGEALKTALYNILRNEEHPFIVYEDGHPKTVYKKFVMVSYSGLYDAYENTDLRADGKIWDMYSNTSNYYLSNRTGGYDGEAPVDSKNYNGKTTSKCMYNREHSVPQSWFNGSEGTPPYSDLFHVYPTDGYVNNMRSNYPFGKVKTVSWESHNGFSKLGSSAIEGYSGTVFEPNDKYKGDFARTYFYMATCYQNVKFTYSGGSDVFESGDKQTYPTLKTWALNMFIEWSHTDEVSDKEYNRNEAVYQLQFNRNPYIDYPGLEQYIWGGMKDVEFSYDNYQVPDNYSLYIPGDDPGPVDPPGPSGEGNVYKRVTSTADLEDGAVYIIVCENKNVAMAEQNSTAPSRMPADVTINNGVVTTTVNTSGKPYELTLGVTSNGKYTFYDAIGAVYLAHSSNNSITTATSVNTSAEKDVALWTISISTSGNNDATITNTKTSYVLKYNSGSSIFRCYSSGQTAVQLYKRQPVSTSVTTEATFPIDKAKPNTIIYDLQGRKVGTTVNGTPHLKKGVYIMSGRKVIVK